MPLFGNKPDTVELPHTPAPPPEQTGSLPENHEHHERELELQKYLDGAAGKLMEQGDYDGAISAIVALGEPIDLLNHAKTLRELTDKFGSLAVKRGEIAEAASRVLQGIPPDQPLESFDPRVLSILELQPNFWSTYQEAKKQLQTRLQVAETNGAAAVEALSQRDNSVETVKLGSFELRLPEPAATSPDLFSKIRSAWMEQTARPVPTPTPDAITPPFDPSPTQVAETPPGTQALPVAALQEEPTPTPAPSPSPTPEPVLSGSNAF